MLLEMDHVKKSYKDFSLDCSLQVMEGKITGLIGANGAGKSTAFKAILNLIRTEGGTVRILGKNGQKLPSTDREHIGVVLAGSSFSGYLYLRDLPGIMKRLYRNFDEPRFLEQCRHFSLPMDKRIKELSTGMKAKLKVLLAMSYGADLLLLDEPTSGLDVVARDEILDLFREYMEKEGRGILISSHISTDLENLCDDVYMIDHGRVILHEDTDILLDRYGVLKVSEETAKTLDKSYLLRSQKESFGYSFLTNQIEYYRENYPSLVQEKCSIDEVITMMVKGEALLAGCYIKTCH